MTDDPNKKQNESGYPAKQPGQSQPNNVDDQQRKNTDDISQRRPAQGGGDVEDDQDQQGKSGQRKAS